jgi:hypothetical protein
MPDLDEATGWRNECWFGEEHCFYLLGKRMGEVTRGYFQIRYFTTLTGQILYYDVNTAKRAFEKALVEQLTAQLKAMNAKGES